MKKVVVVVDEEPIFFEGQNLQIINRSTELDISRSHFAGPELLIVKDSEEELAVFYRWKYWKKIE